MPLPLGAMVCSVVCDCPGHSHLFLKEISCKSTSRVGFVLFLTNQNHSQEKYQHVYACKIVLQGLLKYLDICA